MLQLFVTFVFCIAIVFASDLSENNCDYLKGKSNVAVFDVEKYAGKWFVSNYVINSWRTVENNKNFVECQSLTYELNSDKSGYHIHAENTLVPDMASEYHLFYYQNWVNWTATFDSEKSSVMEMSGKSQPGSMKGVAILDTDYDNYTVEYVCMSYYQMIRLATRTPTAPSVSLSKIFSNLHNSTELREYSVSSYPLLNCK